MASVAALIGHDYEAQHPQLILQRFLQFNDSWNFMEDMYRLTVHIYDTLKPLYPPPPQSRGPLAFTFSPFARQLSRQFLAGAMGWLMVHRLALHSVAHLFL